MRKAVDIGLARSVKASIIRRGTQRSFASRMVRAAAHLRYVVIASPWLSSLEGEAFSMVRLTRVINRFSLPCYVTTREPTSADHLDAVQILLKCPTVELLYNNALHAKIYACVGPYPYGFAILGSANMTMHSLELYEIGLLIAAGGGGDHVVQELANFGMSYLRTRPESKVVKKRGHRRSRHGL